MIGKKPPKCKKDTRSENQWKKNDFDSIGLISTIVP